jgi:hypothetical protein
LVIFGLFPEAWLVVVISNDGNLNLKTPLAFVAYVPFFGMAASILSDRHYRPKPINEIIDTGIYN